MAMSTADGTTFFFLLLLGLVCSTCNAQANTTTPTNITALLVFGDSTMDTGNNDYINDSNTQFSRSDHVPYGQDFPGKVPTGRFSNGKLLPDMIASFLKIKETVPPFLTPDVKDDDLPTGVNFASAASGYDDRTCAFMGSLTVSKQLEMFQNYTERLKRVVGEEGALRIVNGALVIVSQGTNDYLYQIDDSTLRGIEFNSDEYRDFLLTKVEYLSKQLYDLGGRTMVIAGLPPLGCLPIQITNRHKIESVRNCISVQNDYAQSYNKKLKKLLPRIQKSLPGSKLLYSDAYTPMDDMINNHQQKYEFVETKRGCCGTGLFEAGSFCDSNCPVCANASQYLFWDSIHPTEAAYRVIMAYMEKTLLKNLLSNQQI